jgi:hypothetical protein
MNRLRPVDEILAAVVVRVVEPQVQVKEIGWFEPRRFRLGMAVRRCSPAKCARRSSQGGRCELLCPGRTAGRSGET